MSEQVLNPTVCSPALRVRASYRAMWSGNRKAQRAAETGAAGCVSIWWLLHDGEAMMYFENQKDCAINGETKRNGVAGRETVLWSQEDACLSVTLYQWLICLDVRILISRWRVFYLGSVTDQRLVPLFYSPGAFSRLGVCIPFFLCHLLETSPLLISVVSHLFSYLITNSDFSPKL